MIYFLLSITLFGYAFINRVSGLFYGSLFYFTFMMITYPLFSQYEKVIEMKGIKKGIIKFRIKLLLFTITCTLMGIICFHWL